MCCCVLTSEEFKKYIGSMIEKYRLKMCLSQSVIAQAVGESLETVLEYEEGIKIPSIRQLIIISTLLDCSLDDFLPTVAHGVVFDDIDSELLERTIKVRTFVSKLH